MKIDEFALLPLKVEDFLGQSVAVLGIKGSGKSNTAAVLAEELLAANVPLCIVDVAGEYAGLKEKFEIFSIGCSLQPDTLDAKVSPERAAAAAKRSYERGVPVILDVSGYSRQAREIFLQEYMTAIWNLALTLRYPYVLFLEEAHNYIPQSGQTPLTAVLTDFACEGRKRGLGIISIGQRSARIDKNVLAQADILFLHRVRHPADMSVYYDLIPRERKKVQDMVARCKVGDAVVLFGEEVQRHTIRLRHTPHWGYTPSLADLPKNRGVASVDELVQSELPLFQLKS
ncbi:MAG: DUF87 domain-containing protein [Candidatus Competibacter sp.]